MKTLFGALAAAALLSTAAVAEETGGTSKPVPKPAASTTAPAKTKSATVQSEKSKKCSADADAKHLHGKERKAFRKECLKSA